MRALEEIQMLFSQTCLLINSMLQIGWFIFLGDPSKKCAQYPLIWSVFPVAPKYLGQIENSSDLQSL